MNQRNLVYRNHAHRTLSEEREDAQLSRYGTQFTSTRRSKNDHIQCKDVLMDSLEDIKGKSEIPAVDHLFSVHT